MASQNMLTFTDANFDAEVLRAQTPTLVDFWATWCAPCRQIAPLVEQLAEQYSGRLRVGKLDVDSSPKVPTKYDVRSIPTLLIFHNGKVLGRPMMGASTKAKLEEWLVESLGKVEQAS